MQNNDIESLPVIENDEIGKLLGVLDIRVARRSIGAELVCYQTAA